MQILIVSIIRSEYQNILRFKLFEPGIGDRNRLCPYLEQASTTDSGRNCVGARTVTFRLLQ